MNPADYILPPDQVQARFPVGILMAEPETLQAIINACVAQLGVTYPSDFNLSISSTESDDFRARTVTLTVRRNAKPLAMIQTLDSVVQGR